MADPDVEVDHNDALLVLQLREIRLALESCQPGPEGSLSDRALSLQYQLEEFCNQQLRQTGRRVQRSIYQAMLADTAAIGGLVNEDATAVHTTRRGRQGRTRNNRPVRLDEQGDYYEDQRIDASGSTPLDEYVGMLKLDESHPMQTCEACMADDIPYSQSVEVGACTHRWCRSCLTQAFELALQNEQSYPVGCCKALQDIQIDLPAVSKILGPNFVAEFNKKVIEYSTDDRTYCHVPTCSSFINPDTIENRMANCPSCQTSTCSTCKLAFHVEDQCEVARDAEFEEWKAENNASTCPRCGHTILISTGCNHMTCHCGADFCYEYNKFWKSCSCPRWREDRLLDHAEFVAHLRGEPNNVAAVAAELELEPDCRHNRFFRNRDVTSACRGCGWTPDEFIWECNNCDLQVCSRCRTALYG